ncbi:MAG: hypothetical protein F6K37_18670 [Moorea sp. SIO4E2]|uniref:hypothetical protein n=1 Tax=Moorena sp. SIO4E2 TaxID=2607826 RepID=UPI0013B7AF34|nr:hypothetical protein [Moorena sp. SIO4E2]NEQ07895.1 hypothetical protein [Moorena sp. SIO4E2]
MAQALALAFWPFGHATRTATLCERRWDVTQIKQMVTSFIQKLTADSTSSSVPISTSSSTSSSA